MTDYQAETDWDAGRWITEEWRPRNPHNYCIGYPTDEGMIVKNARIRRSHCKQNGEGEDEAGEESDSIVDSWVESNSSSDDYVSEEEGIDENTLLDFDEDESLSLESEDTTRASALIPRANDATPRRYSDGNSERGKFSRNSKRESYCIFNGEREHDHDPTETTEQADSSASAESSLSVSAHPDQKLDGIQQQLMAIERKLRENQLKLEDSNSPDAELCVGEDSNASSVQIFEDKSEGTISNLNMAIASQSTMENSSGDQLSPEAAMAKDAILSSEKSEKKTEKKRSMSISNLVPTVPVIAVEKLSASTSALDSIIMHHLNPEEENSTFNNVDNHLNSLVAETKEEKGNNSNLHNYLETSMQTATTTMKPEEDLSVLTEETGAVVEESPRSSSCLIDARCRSRRRRKSSRKVTRKTDAAMTLSALLDEVISTKDKWDASIEVSSSSSAPPDTFGQRIVLQLERMLDWFVKLADALDLLITFGDPEDSTTSCESTDALVIMESISGNYAPLLNFIWTQQLQSAVMQYWTEEPEDLDLVDLFYRVALVLKILAKELKDLFFVQKRSPVELETTDIKSIFVTLFELLRHDAWAVTVLVDPDTTPTDELSRFRPSVMLQLAWNVDGDSSDWVGLFQAGPVKSWEDGMQRFRRLCCRRLHSVYSGSLLGPNTTELLLEYSEQNEPESNATLRASSNEQLSLEEQKADSENSVADQEKVSHKAPGTSVKTVPDAAKNTLKDIRGHPICRDSLLEDILSHILPVEPYVDDSPVVVSVSGNACVGKTTLAAMVAHMPPVKDFYCDGIVWIGLHGRSHSLSYGQYSSCLRDVCEQLGIINDDVKSFLSFPGHMYVPGETNEQRKVREEQLVSLAKSAMAVLLQDKRVLFILDDVGSKCSVDLFDFSAHESKLGLLITTRCPPLMPKTKTIIVEGFQHEEEALQVLAEECDLCEEWWDSDPADEEPEAARSLSLKCSFHPMAMAILGRILHLQGQQFHMKGCMTLKCIDWVLPTFSNEEDNEIIFEILNMGLSLPLNGRSSSLFNILIVAYVKIFCDQRDYLSSPSSSGGPQVPVDIVELLFESVLILEQDTLQQEVGVLYDQKDKAAELILFVFCTLGVLSDPDSMQRTHLAHSVYQDYVDWLLETDPSLRGYVDPVRWHKALVSNFLGNEEEWYGHRLDYALVMMPSHMIRARMCLEAGDLISDHSFVQGRILNLGLQKATNCQIKDAEYLLVEIMPGSTAVDKAHYRHYCSVVLRQVYFALLRAMTGEPNTCEAARALVDLGVSFSKWHCWEDAIAFWLKSLSLSALPMTDVAAILFRIGAAHEQMSGYDQALRYLNECLEIREEIHGKKGVLYVEVIRKIGDIYCVLTEYSKALIVYTEALGVLQDEPEVNSGPSKDIVDQMDEIQQRFDALNLKREEINML